MKLNSITKLVAASFSTVALQITFSATVVAEETIEIDPGPVLTYTGLEFHGQADHTDWIPIEAMSQGVRRDTRTGKLVGTVKIKRVVDDSSPALVRAFLDGEVFEQLAVGEVDASGAVVDADLVGNVVAVSYCRSRKDDVEMETFAGLLLPAVQPSRPHAGYHDPDSDELPDDLLEPILFHTARGIDKDRDDRPRDEPVSAKSRGNTHKTESARPVPHAVQKVAVRHDISE